jgi:periplasmic protein TonB
LQDAIINILRKEDIIRTDYNDILFQNRNRSYGAYYLRKKQHHFVLFGLFISISALVIGLLMPFVINFFFRSNSVINEDMIDNIQYATMTKGQITPFYIPPPPQKQNVNIPPKVVKDSIPEKKDNLDKKIIADNTSTNKNNKDSSHQSPGTGTPNGDDNQIYLSYDQLPTLKTALYSSTIDYIKKNVEYPNVEKMLRHEGRVTVTAIVNKDGSLENIHLHNHISPALDAEALRVIKAMPKLNPAMRNGKPARIYFMFPVNFQLQTTAQK